MVCTICGKEFESRYPQQKYCCKECQREGRRRRRREAAAEKKAAATAMPIEPVIDPIPDPDAEVNVNDIEQIIDEETVNQFEEIIEQEEEEVSSELFTDTADDNHLKVFDNPEFGAIRVYTDDNGEPWFCGKDVLDALEYSDASNPAKVFQFVPDQWVHVKPIHMNLADGRHQVREALCLSEQGLYFFLGRSDKPKALPYQMYIAGEVMPSIRKYGLYATPKTIDDLIADPDLGIKLFQEIKKEREEKARIKELNEQLMGERQHMVNQLNRAGEIISYVDLIMRNPESLSTREIASDYAMTSQDFHNLLVKAKILYKQGKKYYIYKEHMSDLVPYVHFEAELFEPGSPVVLKWTQEGRFWLYRKLKYQFNFVPLIEREQIQIGGI